MEGGVLGSMKPDDHLSSWSSECGSRDGTVMAGFLPAILSARWKALGTD